MGKKVTFIDGPLNGKSQYIEEGKKEFRVTKIESILPPKILECTYAEMIPGYWHVVKSEIKEFGI